MRHNVLQIKDTKLPEVIKIVGIRSIFVEEFYILQNTFPNDY